MKTFLAIIFMMVLTTNLLGQEDNPDRYTSLTLGAGVTGTEQTFLTDKSSTGWDRYPGYEWKRFVYVPNVFVKLIVPANDFISIILDGNYAFKTNSNYDNNYGGINIKNTVMQTYYASMAFKIYLKD